MPRPRKYDSEQERRQAQNDRRKAEKASPAKTVREFVGVDGEGTGEWKNHTYVLLGIADVQTTDTDGLKFEKIAESLWAQFLAHPNFVFAGFFLGYDFCQWFRSLPEERSRMLFHPEMRKRRPKKIDRETGEILEENPLGPFPVRYKGWEFDLLGMKRFKLRKEGTAEWMYINDAGPFFQASFLRVIDPEEWGNDPVVTQEEYEKIKEGKDRRDVAVLDDNMRLYNALENAVLPRVLERMDKGLQRAGVYLKKDQWFGPGQAAQAWLAHIRAPTGKMVRDALANNGTNRDILYTGRMSYYGGWFEIFAHGHIPSISWEYDINSAYPYIAASLPCLLHGRWSKDESPVHADIRRSEYRLVHARVSGSDPVCGSMLHRRTNHSILRPSRTQGWYWESELAAGIRAGIIDDVEVLEGMRYEPCGCSPPLRGLAGLYDERLRVGKNTPEGKAFKLIYNSVYGKFAQSIGNPKYGNSIYASLITSGCREMIVDAIGTHPEGTNALVMVATDGVYFRSKHSGLALGSAMGQWEENQKKNLTLFKPGVYWDASVRQRIADGRDPRFKSRGISARAFAGQLSRIDAEFSSWGRNASVAIRDFPKVTFTNGFSMITCLQALQRGKWHLAGTLGHEPNDICNGCGGAHLIQDSDPVSKRRGLYRTGDIWRSRPWETGGADIESVPYDRAFGQPDPDEYGITDDGTVLDGWRISE